MWPWHGIVIGLGLVGCADPDPEPASSMMIGDRTVVFDAASVVGSSDNMVYTYEAHSPGSGPVTEQVSAYINASGEGVIAHDYVCGAPIVLTVTIVDLGTEYVADATHGTCVFAVNGMATPGGPMTADVYATAVSAAGESLTLTAHIAAHLGGQ